MISLSRICFSLALAAPLFAASVGGRVELIDSRDPDVKRRKDFSGVVIWLEPADGRKLELAPKTAKMVQKDKRFIPHVLAVPVGTKVDFPNFDPIFHNAFSNFSGQKFDTGLYPPGTSASVVFQREGIVRMFCNIHSTMSAVIVVLATPYLAVTARDGSFQIDNVPPGDYRMKVWHERATEEFLRGLDRRISAGDGSATMPVIRISESGYIEVPHQNKYGQDYPPAPADHQVYPGVRR